MYYRSLYDFEYKYYDLLYSDFQEDINFYKKFIKKEHRILELMCGTGRIISAFKDHQIVGIDNNEHMLNVAKKKFKNLKNITLLKQDIRSLNLEDYFDTILIPLNSFLLFDELEQILILKNSLKHLNEGGNIFIDLLNGFPYLENLVYHGETKEFENGTISRFFVPSLCEGGKFAKLLYFYDILKNGTFTRDYSELKLRIMYKNDLEDVASKSELRILNLFGDYDLSKFNAEYSERIIAVLGV